MQPVRSVCRGLLRGRPGSACFCRSRATVAARIWYAGMVDVGPDTRRSRTVLGPVRAGRVRGSMPTAAGRQTLTQRPGHDEREPAFDTELARYGRPDEAATLRALLHVGAVIGTAVQEAAERDREAIVAARQRLLVFLRPAPGMRPRRHQPPRRGQPSAGSLMAGDAPASAGTSRPAPSVTGPDVKPFRRRCGCQPYRSPAAEGICNGPSAGSGGGRIARVAAGPRRPVRRRVRRSV